MKSGFDISKTLYLGLSAIFMIVFIPVLFCIFMFGNTMDYNTVNKLLTTYGNKRLAIFSFFIIFVIILVLMFLKKVVQSSKTSIITVACLSVAFIMLYFINEEICKCIWFPQGWDVSQVTGTAYNLNAGNLIGNDTYYSIYPNNVPMAFILYRIYSFAANSGLYSLKPEFLWIQVICGMISIAGMAMCLTIQKLTNHVGAVLAGFVLYVACIGISPWKTVPYTDMYALLFPILSLCLYVYYYYAKNNIVRMIYFGLAFLTGVLGSLVKPTVLIVAVAIGLVEVSHLVFHMKQEWKQALIKLGLIVLTVFLYKGALNHIYEETGYEPNKEISATFHHYMVMGLNQDTTGSYSSEDAALIGQYPNREERIEVQMGMVAARIKEMGLVGYLKFLLTKTVMTFNDGTFNWGREGVYYLDKYPVLSQGAYAFALKNIFWPEHQYSETYHTICQTVWLAVLFALPGLCLYKKYNRGLNLILLSILGIMLYLMLFEARARYLICFTPIFILGAVIGIVRYFELVQIALKKLAALLKNRMRQRAEK